MRVLGIQRLRLLCRRYVARRYLSPWSCLIRKLSQRPCLCHTVLCALMLTLLHGCKSSTKQFQPLCLAQRIRHAVREVPNRYEHAICAKLDVLSLSRLKDTSPASKSSHQNLEMGRRASHDSRDKNMCTLILCPWRRQYQVGSGALLSNAHN